MPLGHLLYLRDMRDIAKIIKYSWKLWRYYVTIAILVIVVALLGLASPFLVKMIVDGLVANSAGGSYDISYFLIIVAIILLSDVTATFISNVNGYLGDMMSVKLNTLLSQRYYDHLMQLPIEYYDNEITGKITARLDRTIGTISTLMQTMANNFAQFFLTTLITLIFISYYSWPVALLLIIIFPTYIYITQLSSKHWQAAQEGINQDLDVANGRFIESVSQIRVVKSFVTDAMESAFYRGKRRKIEDQTKGQSVTWHKYDVARRLVLNVVFALIYGYITWQAYTKAITLGEFTLLLQLVTQAQMPLFGSSFIVDALQRAKAGSKDYFGVMGLAPSISDESGAKPLKVRNGEVSYQAINFGYQGGKQVLRDVSFDIKPGQKVALVGESGEGKSTIANLMLRFYELDGGKVLIDGKDVTQVTQASLRKNIGVVFQEPALFSGTVGENIAYGSGKVSQAKLEAAAKAANALDFIKKLDKGFDTQIGERGVKLSGGQKQRIAIARAILKDAPILILDEATSSLDSKAEREVQTALERLMHGRTTMIIAHRLSTIANVDVVIGIQGGKIIEMGSPAELAKGDGIYAELLKLQSGTPSKQTKAKLKQFEIVSG